MTDWRVYRKNVEPHDDIDKLPPPPPWRQYRGAVPSEPAIAVGAGTGDLGRGERSSRGREFRASEQEVDVVNAALYLRRPLLITGRPGTGKSSLPYSIAWQLKLGEVLRWPITSRSTLQEGLYRYDALGRLQDANIDRAAAAPPEAVGRYIRLGPLGTALYPARRPRVLLIDEIDKGDIDLPNDLLNVFEEGEFEIPELSRLPGDVPYVDVMPYDGRSIEDSVSIHRGRIECSAFPIIVLTSNGERDFPAAFLRRCLRLDILMPDKDRLAEIIKVHLNEANEALAQPLIDRFLADIARGESLATDQLLNAIHLLAGPEPLPESVSSSLRQVLLRPLER